MKVLLIMLLLSSCSRLSLNPTARDLKYNCVKDLVEIGVDALKSIAVCERIYKLE